MELPVWPTPPRSATSLISSGYRRVERRFHSGGELDRARPPTRRASASWPPLSRPALLSPVPISSSTASPTSPWGGALTTTKVSQPYPVNPKAGNLLVAIIAGGVFTGLSAGSFPTFPVYTVTDTAGNSWRWGGESGLDPTEGVDWGIWFCTAKGGATTLTATFPQPSEAAQFNLLFVRVQAGYPFNPDSRQLRGTEEGALRSVSTNAAILAGDFGIAMRGYILGSGPVAPASGWQMVHSDTSGNGNAQCILSTAAGVLTVTYTEAGGQGAVDIVVSALRPSPGFGAH